MQPTVGAKVVLINTANETGQTLVLQEPDSCNRASAHTCRDELRSPCVHVESCVKQPASTNSCLFVTRKRSSEEEKNQIVHGVS